MRPYTTALNARVKYATAVQPGEGLNELETKLCVSSLRTSFAFTKAGGLLRTSI